MKTFRQQWESYRERVVPANAPVVQVQESRRAFYAGIAAAIECFNATPDDPAGEDAAAGVLGDELRQFEADVLAGRA